MPLPLVTTLNAAARRALPIIEGGVSQGLSSTAIQQAIRDAYGTGIRRQTLLDVMREIRGIERSNKALQFVKTTATPNPARFPLALTKIRRRYSYRVQVTGSLIDANQPYSKAINIASDRALSRQEAEEAALDALSADPERYNVDVASVRLIGAVRAGEAGTLE